MFKTEHEFTLPMGYLDAEGALHRDGIMRLATAADEIVPLKDPRVQKNQAYLTVILLSRVVTRLGAVDPVTPRGHRRAVRCGPGLPPAPVQRDQPGGLGSGRYLSAVLALLLPGERAPGGIRGYPLDQLREEVAFVAYHFHWPHDEITAMEHAERRHWVGAISALNQRMNDE